jgi:hypothetical protein
MPPTWLDAHGRRQPTRPCWECGQETPVTRFQAEDLRRLGWVPWQTHRIVSWCGHSQEYQPWPVGGGWWHLVPVYDPQAPPRNPLQRDAPAEA